jgi:hypothetical protein
MLLEAPFGLGSPDNEFCHDWEAEPAVEKINSRVGAFCTFPTREFPSSSSAFTDREMSKERRRSEKKKGRKRKE